MTVHAHALRIPPSSSRVTTDDAQVEGQVVNDGLWIVADFRDDQLAQIRPGQPAIVRIGTHGSRAFAARVESIAASGARLRLVPPEGESLQSSKRFPVRLEFVATPDVPLRPGTRATVAVYLR